MDIAERLLQDRWQALNRGLAPPPPLLLGAKRMDELKNRLAVLSVEVSKASKAIYDFTEKKMVR